jgi:predicted 3-demethylubiquinone-9 3-methyltransferase (glyoxalase superfamily)
MSARDKIMPFLWFDTEAEEAANYYISVFKTGHILNISRYGDAVPQKAGSVLVVTFELFGRQFGAINGGPHFKFSEAISLAVDCKSQAEVDELWDKLSAGGATSQCGWLKDKYGLSWQIVPARLNELMEKGDAEKSNRMMAALFKMTKLDIAALEAAYEGH